MAVAAPQLVFGSGPMVIGMVHLPALPGSPGWRVDEHLEAVRRRALRDARALVGGGIHALMMENFGDAPFYPHRVPAHVVAAMTVLAGDIRRAFPRVPLGLNVLRNDGRSALAIAAAVGGAFIRVNVLCGARVTDQGILEGIAHNLLRERAQLAPQVRILADVDVKHSAALAPRPLEEEVADTVHRGLADAVVVSGAGTGLATDPEKVRRVRAAAGGVPVFVGSGITAATVGDYAGVAEGFIVGTALKRHGRVSNPIDPARVRQLVRRLSGG